MMFKPSSRSPGRCAQQDSAKKPARHIGSKVIPSSATPRQINLMPFVHKADNCRTCNAAPSPALALRSAGNSDSCTDRRKYCHVGKFVPWRTKQPHSKRLRAQEVETRARSNDYQACRNSYRGLLLANVKPKIDRAQHAPPRFTESGSHHAEGK